MYAIVNISGKQHKVEPNTYIYVDRLPYDEGAEASFSDVLLVDNNGAITIGKPFVSGASVRAQVLTHLKDDKVIVFKKKRRKGYRVKNGHRQAITKLQIHSISL